ncbi:MAG TPA: hypothetical protein VFF06_31330 [Polyangia bacterium]|nr:hypothetical protein [Polyangia bacterium]
MQREVGSKGIVLAVLVAAAAGCLAPRVAVMTNRVGNRYPAREPDCALEFAYSSPGDQLKDLKKYEVVAMLGTSSSLDVGDEWSDELKEALRPEACRVGADRVVMLMVGSASNIPGASRSGGAFQALRRRSEATAKRSAPSDD